MADSFWTGGHDAYVKGLQDQYEEHLQQLTAQLNECEDEAGRQAILGSIRALKAEHRRKLDESDRNIH